MSEEIKWAYPREWLRWKADTADREELRRLLTIVAISTIDKEIIDIFHHQMQEDGYNGWQG